MKNKQDFKTIGIPTKCIQCGNTFERKGPCGGYRRKYCFDCRPIQKQWKGPIGGKEVNLVCSICDNKFLHKIGLGPFPDFCSKKCRNWGLWQSNYPDRKNPDGTKFGFLDRDRLYQIQQGRCALCGRHETDPALKGKILFVDHDHKTGIVRGLLCPGCNICVGWYESITNDKDGFYKKVNLYLNNNRGHK